MAIRNTLLSSLLLGLFAIIGTGLVAMTYDATDERIKENERQALLRSLHALVPTQRHDNDPYNDVIEVTAPEKLGSKDPVRIYRARMKDKPVAAIIASIAPDGYSGGIKLLVAVNYGGELAGVRVISHRETPGLGDRIEERRSDWILDFTGRSLNSPNPEQWKVKKDGGVFDQFTGATITPRAIVKAVHNSLLYYRDNEDSIFNTPAKFLAEETKHTNKDTQNKDLQKIEVTAHE